MKPNYRRCISCRSVGVKEQFHRIVREHATGELALQSGMGRSAYICRNKNCLEIALTKKRLNRALKAPIPDSLMKQLWKIIASYDET
ncbi:MAG: YlxR family protein [Synechococcaceae cyanobacterium RL_1_2]|nr:YlxR family protein [Synechococcaceae cyanobacterium RL_1_2]